MTKPFFLLCTIFIIGVNAASIKNTNTQVLLLNLTKGLEEFDNILNSFWNKTNTRFSEEELYLYDFHYEIIKRIDDHFEDTRDSLKRSNHLNFNKFEECEHFIDDLENVYLDQKEIINDCTQSRYDTTGLFAYQTIVDAKKVKRIMTANIRKFNKCKGEKCRKRHIPDYLNYSNSAIAKLNKDISEFYALFEDTKPVVECINQNTSNEIFSKQRNKYIDAFQNCVSHDTNETLEQL